VKEDHGLTAIQKFLKDEARKARQLWCTVCKLVPPRHPGGPCDDCHKELGTG
jgi:hypothetical protein